MLETELTTVTTTIQTTQTPTELFADEAQAERVIAGAETS